MSGGGLGDMEQGAVTAKDNQQVKIRRERIVPDGFRGIIWSNERE